MKLKWTSETTVKVISNCIVVAVGLLLYFAILNWDKLAQLLRQGVSLLGPFIWGFVFAYLLSTPMKFIERAWLRGLEHKIGYKWKRVVSVSITMLLALLVVAALFAILIPQLVQSVYQLVGNIPQYKSSVEATVSQWMNTLNISGDFLGRMLLSWEDYLTKTADLITKVAPYIYNFSRNVTVSVANAIIGIIIAVYLLFGKEKFIAQLKKFLYAVFPTKRVDSAVELAHSSHEVFGNFINGKLIDSLIIGILCFVGCSILRIPYALLISVIVGVTNVIPFFGPIIGAVPCGFILLIVDPQKCLWFIIFVIALQQFDGNVLGPKILGNTIGISAFWVMFAILIGGGLFGFVGMFIGVPAFAVLYALVRRAIENALCKKGLPTKTTDYSSQEHQIHY